MNQSDITDNRSRYSINTDKWRKHVRKQIFSTLFSSSIRFLFVSLMLVLSPIRFKSHMDLYYAFILPLFSFCLILIIKTVIDQMMILLRTISDIYILDEKTIVFERRLLGKRTCLISDLDVEEAVYFCKGESNMISFCYKVKVKNKVMYIPLALYDNCNELLERIDRFKCLRLETLAVDLRRMKLKQKISLYQ